MKVKSESEVTQPYPTFHDTMDCRLQAHPSMGFSRQEYWSGLPFPSPGGDVRKVITLGQSKDAYNSGLGGNPWQDAA